MKWANISKTVRRSTWHTVTAPKNDEARLAGLWCRQHPSTGRFYNHYTNSRWWFEDEKDALLFSIRWSK